MKWTNVWLIFQREVKDQLRDRRTIFTIAMMPLLLYPLLGMSFLQVAQFLRDQPIKVWVVGASHLPDRPALLDGERFSSDYCSEDEHRLIDLHLASHLPDQEESLRRLAEQELEAGRVDAVVFFPPQFAEKLERLHQPGNQQSTAPPAAQVPQPEIFVNSADDRSRIAIERVNSVLARWRRGIVRQYLEQRSVPETATEPFQVVQFDVAEEKRRQALVWSKVLPFVVFVWALTGAFYPAIDVCAGEKERGTLETLLSSPALRREIVWGKLLTVVSFSMATALLNLFSMTLTGTIIIRQLAGMPGAEAMQLGAPPAAAVGWLILALIPVSALFGALSLAIAAFARSSKEGQYYLMPLLLISLPLMILPMLPSAQLDMGTSLIPITGLVLLLRALVEGQVAEAVYYVPGVVVITSICCLLAVRWAVDQFNKETVLFRESERWSLRLWLQSKMKERRATPGISEAIGCGLLLLLIRFFATLSASAPASWSDFATTQLITLIALIAAPALLMTICLTRSARQTLLLRAPRPAAAVLAVALAISLHPLAMAAARGIEQLYPLGDEVRLQMQGLQVLLDQAPSFAVILLVMALAPAICEELAFRGFILSGLRHLGHRWAAIVISSVFFGLAHGLLQQSIAAGLVGLVIGYIAVQTGSLLPCILFHFVYNSLSLTMGLRLEGLMERWPFLATFFSRDADRLTYHTPFVVLGAAVSFAILLWFHRLPCEQTDEERLQDALDHQAMRPA